jgi:alanine or glycine:cation symporter, AGCS family
MQSIETILNNITDFVWGQPLLILLVGTHLYLTVRLGFVQRYLWTSIKLSFSKKHEGERDISHFGALTTALAATIGTGNIIGNCDNWEPEKKLLYFAGPLFNQ